MAGLSHSEQEHDLIAEIIGMNCTLIWRCPEGRKLIHTLEGTIKELDKDRICLAINCVDSEEKERGEK